jgi:Tfp pilus assembly protein PilF
MTLEERIQTEDAWGALREGRTDKAEKEIVRLGPASPLYSVGLGYLALIRENFQDAEGYLRQAVEKYPDSALVHLGLVQLYQKTKDSDRAFNELREVLKIDPQNGWAREQFEALKTQKTDLAVEEARSAMAQGDIEKGTEAYLKALHFSPESPAIHLALAEIYKKQNKPSSAIIHLKAAAAADPENVKILEEYAATLAEARQYERSLEVYGKLRELEPSNKKVQEQVEDLKNKLGIFELPSKYNDILSSPAITREDLAALLAVKLRDFLAESPTQPPIIVDISASWASKFILKITSLGVLEVYANHTFQPHRTVSRAELAEALYRVIGSLEERGRRFFRQIGLERIQIADVTADHYYYQPISQILSYQIMELYPDRTFRPDQPVNGSDAIKALDVLLALVR